MGADIRGKIDFLGVVSRGRDAIVGYYDDLKTTEEREKFYQLVCWGERSNCTSGLKMQEDILCLDNPSLTGLGKVVYHGRKDLILK